MRSPKRVVVDNNALISRLLLPPSIPARAVQRVVNTAQLLVSEPVMLELADVLARRKFDPYISLEDRQDFLRLLGRTSEIVSIVSNIRACPDPKADNTPDPAVNGSDDPIIT